MPTPTPTEQIITSYLTVAGAALADRGLVTTVVRGGDQATARCVCGAQRVSNTFLDLCAAERGGDPDGPSQYADRWAREHAARCRALPQPTA